MGQKQQFPSCGCEKMCLACMRMGGRALAKEAASLSLVGRKSTPERLTRLLDYMQRWPHVTHACAFVGITYPTLRYWILKSEKGHIGDGFDLEYQDQKKRFHEHFYDARDSMTQMVEDAYTERALNGFYETLHHQGRVLYQYDEGLLALGLEGPEAYLRDERGKPIPERIQLQDPDVQLNVLKAYRRDRWGAREQLDVMHRGGVLVVGMRAKDSKELEQRERDMIANPIDVEFRELPEPEPEAD